LAVGSLKSFTAEHAESAERRANHQDAKDAKGQREKTKMGENGSWQSQLAA